MRLLPLLALLVAGPASAQDSAPPVAVRPAQPVATIIAEPVAMMIAAFDGDFDARVTRAEFDTGVRRSFDSADTARAGSIGYLAFSDWSERWLGNRNALPSPFETDRDGDNRIRAAEFEARFEMFFRRFDADKDGVLLRRELVTLRQPPGDPRSGKKPR